MIKDYDKFRIFDKDGKTLFYVEVNWKDDPAINECKLLKMTPADNPDKHYFVQKEMLMGLLWVIGTNEEQRKMIPGTIKKTRLYESVIGIKAQKDIKKGEMINFPLRLTLPSIDEEIILDATKSLGKSGKLGDKIREFTKRTNKQGLVVPKK